MPRQKSVRITPLESFMVSMILRRLTNTSEKKSKRKTCLSGLMPNGQKLQKSFLIKRNHPLLNQKSISFVENTLMPKVRIKQLCEAITCQNELLNLPISKATAVCGRWILQTKDSQTAQPP